MSNSRPTIEDLTSASGKLRDKLLLTLKELDFFDQHISILKTNLIHNPEAENEITLEINAINEATTVHEQVKNINSFKDRPEFADEIGWKYLNDYVRTKKKKFYDMAISYFSLALASDLTYSRAHYHMGYAKYIYLERNPEPYNEELINSALEDVKNAINLEEKGGHAQVLNVRLRRLIFNKTQETKLFFEYFQELKLAYEIYENKETYPFGLLAKAYEKAMDLDPQNIINHREKAYLNCYLELSHRPNQKDVRTQLARLFVREHTPALYPLRDKEKNVTKEVSKEDKMKLYNEIIKLPLERSLLLTSLARDGDNLLGAIMWQPRHIDVDPNGGTLKLLSDHHKKLLRQQSESMQNIKPLNQPDSNNNNNNSNSNRSGLANFSIFHGVVDGIEMTEMSEVTLTPISPKLRGKQSNQ